MNPLHFGLLALGGMIAGCADASVDGQDSAATVEYTAVTAAGAKTVTLSAEDAARQTTALAQAKAELGGAAKGSIVPEFTLDSGCAGPDLWLYDQPNQQGNRICFATAANGGVTADLIDYAYPGGGTWAGNERSLSIVSRVKSYWGGSREAIGACQDSAGRTPVNCNVNPVFDYMPADAKGNITNNLRSVVEYAPIE